MKWLVAIAVVIGARSADARCRICRLADELQGGAFMHYELTGLEHVDDGPHGTPADELILVGAKLHGFVGVSEDVQYHVGFDLAGGATLSRGGFAYDVALFPLGIAARFGRTSFIAFGTGVSFMGATRSLDDAVLLPLETTVELDVSKRLRVLGRFRAAYAAGAPARHDGAPSIAFADELEAMAGVRIGHHYEDYGFPSGNGYFVAASYRELYGTRFLGLTLGYSIDIGTPDSYKRRLRHRHEGEPAF
jgi:hypothetical protein